MQLKNIMRRRWGRGKDPKKGEKHDAKDGAPNSPPSVNHTADDNRRHHSASDIHTLGASSHASSGPTHSTCSSKPLHRSTSQIGLDEFIESRKDDGGFASKMVNIEVRDVSLLIPFLSRCLISHIL